MVPLQLKLAVEAKWTKVIYSDLRVDTIAHQLNQYPDTIILIENFPVDDLSLNQVISEIGEPIIENRNRKSKTIFEVKVEKDSGEFKSFANTNYNFPLHTDCSDFESVPNAVALQCIKQSQTGGENQFVQLADLLLNIPLDLKSKLLKKRWQFRNTEKCILKNDELNYLIHYNRLIMETYSQLSIEDKQLLDQFESFCNQFIFQIRLKPSDLILFRNDKILHGRAEFPANSNRLLKRVRFQLNKL